MEFLAVLLLAPYLWIAAAVVVCVFIAALTENDAPGKATLLALVVAVVFEVFSPFKPLSSVISNPLVSISAVVAYFATGAAYGVLKWWRFVVTMRERFDESLAEQLDRKKVTSLSELTSVVREDVIERATRASVGYGRTIPPQIAQHKARFMGWAAYWPVSALWTLCNDPVRRILNAIYNALAVTLQNISNSAFGEVPSNKG